MGCCVPTRESLLLANSSPWGNHYPIRGPPAGVDGPRSYLSRNREYVTVHTDADCGIVHHDPEGQFNPQIHISPPSVPIQLLCEVKFLRRKRRMLRVHCGDLRAPSV